MKVRDLILALQKYPEDMSIWVSDGGMSEGGTPLESIRKVLATEVCLDGDEVGDEYVYVDDNTNISEYLVKGYVLDKNNVLSKSILIINEEF